MRKADYAMLADLVRVELQHAARNEKNVTLGSGYFQGYTYALHQMAHDFAEGASVDKVAFLKACGLS